MSKKKAPQRPFQTRRGSPLPLGSSVTDSGVNFALFSRHATSISLVFDCPSKTHPHPVRHEIILDPAENKTGDVWHIWVQIDPAHLAYGYRIDGPFEPEASGSAYAAESILIDPYAHQLLPRKWGSPSEYGRIPCCTIASHDFDWQDDRPPKTPLTETVIYELHVRGFTKGKGAQVRNPGTYLGLIDKISYLKELGVSAIELMPVTEFDENDTNFTHPTTKEPLRNYWGYNPISFFAVKSGYAADPENHLNEFKQMVLAMHKAGIEVYLDMVYNHTGEGGYKGITSSFRGIDNQIYYLLDPATKEYSNFSGCGNTLNCNHPIVRSLIRESLRYWVTEMHIDGFRFDLASILGRDQQGKVLANPPMIEIITEDPVLRDTKIIAEAWDAAGLYQVGSFSSNSRWAEWNGHFRDDVRAFMAGHQGRVARLATRLAGSSDLYQSSNRTPQSSINFLTSHDGFTLYDLVSYDRKHNLENGEQDRDGENNNLSWNSGCEGNPCPQPVSILRQRRIRSMMVILLLSQGVPMLTAGDELGRSQAGNNNAWCQDNLISWLDWSMLATNTTLHRFVRDCIRLRATHPVFRRNSFFQTKQMANSVSSGITWQYLTPGNEDWSENCPGLGVLLHGQRPDGPEDDDFFLMFNGSRSDTLHFTLPEIPENRSRRWHTLIDTAAEPPDDFQLNPQPISPAAQKHFSVAPLAVCVLRSLPFPEKTRKTKRTV